MLLPEILCMPASAGLNHTSFTTPRFRPLPSMSRHPWTLMARAAPDPKQTFAEADREVAEGRKAGLQLRPTE